MQLKQWHSIILHGQHVDDSLQQLLPLSKKLRITAIGTNG